MADNIERTSPPSHDVTKHPSWAPGSSIGGMIERHHFASGRRMTLPQSGDPADAEIVTDDIDASVDRVSIIAHESFESFVMPVTNYLSANGGPVNILIYDDQRKRAIIRNNDATVLLLVGKLAQVQVGTAFLVPPGQQIEILTRQAVFAAAASGSASIMCSVWLERGQ